MMQACYKTLFVIFLSTAFSISIQAQNQHKIDSLQSVLKTVNVDTNKVKTLLLLSVEFSNNNPDTAKYYAQLALILSEKLKYKKGQANSLREFAYNLRLLGDYQLALTYQIKALKVSEETGNKLEIFKANNSIGNTYRDMGEYKKEMEYRLKALQIAEKMNDRKFIAYAYGNLGGNYRALGDYSNGMNYVLKALKLHEELKDTAEISSDYNRIGNIYRYMNNLGQSFKYQMLALNLDEASGNKRGVLLNSLAIAQIFRDSLNYTEAMKWFSKSLQLSEELKNKKMKAISLCGIGQVLGKQGKNKEAVSYYIKALAISEEIGDKQSIAVECGELADIYIKEKNFNEAINYLLRCMAIDKETGDAEELSNDYKSLANCYFGKNDFKHAYENLLLHSELNNSLLNKESSKHTAEMEAKYNNEKKEKEIILLNADKKIKDVEIKKQTLLKNSLIVGLTLVFILFFFIYKNYRSRQKLKLETIRNNIAADLHDDIGSTLNSISLFSEVAKQEAGKPIPALDQIGVSARKIIDAMGDIVWTINPENDSFENVIARMRSLAYMLLKAKGIEFTFKADEGLNQLSLPMPVRKNFYLLFKEATNNLVKYSNATRASFHLSLENKNVKMIIRDNGLGFDMEHALMGNGIKNMKRRASEIGAQFLIESSVGKGTNIELSFKI